MTNHLGWTSAIANSLYEQGVRHAILSPGSRSTPLTLAFANHPGFDKTVVLDERSSAFIALGIGNESGIPAVLICTSGSAAANYFPAIIEAKKSGVPLIVLTADRPPHLRGIGSSQTIDQIKLFGDQAVFFHEAGEPVDEEMDIKRISLAAKQAVHDAIRIGGASHINLPFRKPLEPTQDQLESAIDSMSKFSSVKVKSKASIQRTIRFDEELSELFNQSKKPLIIAGPSNHHQSLAETATELQKRLSAPLLAEPGSTLSPKKGLYRFEQFLRNKENLNSLKPDLIIRIGDQPFTKSLLTALDVWSDVDVIHFSGREAWQDSAMSSTVRFVIHQTDSVDYSPIKKKPATEWLDAWKTSENNSETSLKNSFKKSSLLSDGHVFNHISKISEDWNVMISNSLPVRDMSLFGKPTAQQFVNRGTAGIDGILSTGVGISRSSQKPTLCLIGDLAFLH
ncbi:MAG: 2-succinyl-5-enolpyruvyl-6-hydroxy-3-cyclohexene-1-carboxylic-acid synthase, partial [Balneolaceae bacterium]